MTDTSQFKNEEKEKKREEKKEKKKEEEKEKKKKKKMTILWLTQNQSFWVFLKTPQWYGISVLY